MSESSLYAEILAEHSRGDCRLFRQNAGFAWQGQVIEQTAHRLVLANPRPLRMGVPGMSDLGGWVTVDTEAALYCGIARLANYVAIECKSARGRLTPEQANFIELVRRSGGRAGVARSVEDAGIIVRGEA